MSKSSNMLRTRRKDNNVKPNRRLDRKSSRGMLFENEDLRLKTININAEVERGQSDIKKLKRENDQLRREIWYLRDEYDKLDKLLRDKECRSSSSASSSSGTSASDTESCSSCTEESEAVETSQNIENFQKTAIKKLNEEFDNLSIVPEENSAENSSDKNSNNSNLRALQPLEAWSADVDVIPPDQGYPPSPKHFFSPIKSHHARYNDDYADYVNNQFLGGETRPYHLDEDEDDIGDGFATESHFFPRLILPALNKTTTDVIVKTDNQNFNTMKSRSSFSNGGNLEELLQDIETISHDILNITNSQTTPNPPPQNHAACDDFSAQHYSENLSDILSQIQNSNVGYLPTSRVDNYEFTNPSPLEKPYKSELNVVLMPSPMQLIEVEKYKTIQKSCESLHVSAPDVAISPDQLYGAASTTSPLPEILHHPLVPVPPNCPAYPKRLNEETNPFLFGSAREDWKTSPETPATFKSDLKKDNEVYNSKTNLLDMTVSSDHVSSENEENLKFKTTREQNKIEKTINDNKKKDPKSARRRVSIHFKGRKDKSVKTKDDKPKTPIQEKKPLFFDIRFSSDTKNRKSTTNQKTSSVEPKTPNTAESKASTSDTKNSKTDSKNSDSNSDQKIKPVYETNKSRKSSSASPDRKHGQKEAKKSHKKHKNKGRRSSTSIDRIHHERSYSVCTDRSNILEHKMNGVYDGFTTSDRERTNSLSSCDTMKARKLSNSSHFPATGKIPWCGCWGNGCL